MKKSLIVLAALALTGCSGLNVSWSLVASYNTKVQAGAVVEHGQEEAKPVPPPLPAAKSL